MTNRPRLKAGTNGSAARWPMNGRESRTMRANEDGQDLRNLSAVIARNAKRIRELEAALTDMTRQRDELLGAVQAWHGAEYSERIEFKLTDAMKYCTEWT